MNQLKKRDRASNFQKSEVIILTELVSKYRSILENKKTDAVTNKNKNAAWNKIASTFNAASNGISRSARTLKMKYESMKKIVKKKLTCRRQEFSKTGGVPSNAPDLNEDEGKLLAIYTDILGLHSRHDSDNIADNQIEIAKNDTPQLEVVYVGRESITPVLDGTADFKFNEGSVYDMTPSEVIGKNVIEITDSNNKWETWNPKSLKSKISKQLKPMKATRHTVTEKPDELSSARLELVKLQQRIAETEHLFKKEEHELKMSNLRNEENRKAELHQLMLIQRTGYVKENI